MLYELCKQRMSGMLAQGCSPASSAGDEPFDLKRIHTLDGRLRAPPPNLLPPAAAHSRAGPAAPFAAVRRHRVRLRGWALIWATASAPRPPPSRRGALRRGQCNSLLRGRLPRCRAPGRQVVRCALSGHACGTHAGSRAARDRQDVTVTRLCRILDLGCGTGLWGLLAAHTVSARRSSPRCALGAPRFLG